MLNLFHELIPVLRIHTVAVAITKFGRVFLRALLAFESDRRQLATQVQDLLVLSLDEEFRLQRQVHVEVADRHLLPVWCVLLLGFSSCHIALRSWRQRHLHCFGQRNSVSRRWALFLFLSQGYQVGII